MAFLDEVRKGLSNTGKQVVKKTKEITDTVQLKSQISAEKETIQRLYAAVGKQVFDAATEEDEKRFFTEFASLRKSLKKKEELEETLAGLDGCIYCSECGARIERTSVYCSHCGAKVDQNKRAVGEAVADSLHNQMDGTREEEEEAQMLANEIETVSADITMDMVNH